MERIDRKRTTFDCGVRANFVQESRASASDENSEVGMLDFFGTIQDILKVGFRRFDMFIFDVKWFKVVTTGAHARETLQVNTLGVAVLQSRDPPHHLHL